MNTPNTEQLAAVRDYALAVGPEWKSSLSADWMRAGTAVSSMRDRYHLLQHLSEPITFSASVGQG